MSFQLKQLLQVNQDADRLWSTDKTGAFVSSFNETGWGTPNPILGFSAQLLLALRKGDTDEQLSVVGTNLFYNPSSPNTQETSCEFILAQDGWHRVYEMQFDVSLNDSTLAKDDTTIPEDSFYYYNGDIFHRVSGVGVLIPIDGYTELIGNDNIVQDFAENIFFPQLSIKLSRLYKSYVKSRDGDCDDKDALQRRYDDLRADLESAYNLFWTGLTVKSADLIDSLLKKYIDV